MRQNANEVANFQQVRGQSQVMGCDGMGRGGLGWISRSKGRRVIGGHAA